MRRKKLGILILCGMVLLAGAVLLPGSAYCQREGPIYVKDWMLLHADKDPNNWLLYGRDYASHRYSPLKQITRENINRLVPKWAFSMGVLDGQNSQVMANNGTLYVTSAWSKLFCLDGKTGELLWKYEHPLPEEIGRMHCCDVVNRGVGLYRDKVYFGTLDGHVVALEYKTGEVLWDTTITDWTSASGVTLLPMLVNGMVIVGPTGGEFGNRGFLTALDAETGEEVWKTYTIPGPGERNFIVEEGQYQGQPNYPGDTWKTGGGCVWTTGSYDPELNTIYWGIGNPAPDFNRHVRVGANLYSESTIALNADTGEIVNHYQYFPNDPYDFDAIAEPILVDIKGRKLWLVAWRGGFFYAIDRTNAEFVWGMPYTEVNWATLGGDGIIVPDWPKWDVTLDRPIIGQEPTICGGKNWYPMTYSERTGFVYVPSFNLSWDIQADEAKYTKGEWFIGGKSFNWHPGYGSLNAIDVHSMEEGSHPPTFVWRYVTQAPPTSGTVSTAGGLVFMGSPEGYLKAFDDETGQILWRFNTGSGIRGNTTTFMVGDEQMVAVPSGYGGWTGWAPGGAATWLTPTKGCTVFGFSLFEE